MIRIDIDMPNGCERCPCHYTSAHMEMGHNWGIDHMCSLIGLLTQPPEELPEDGRPSECPLLEENDSEDRVLVVKCLSRLSPGDFISEREALKHQLESGVVVLPNYYEFCCVAPANEVEIIQ